MKTTRTTPGRIFKLPLRIIVSVPEIEIGTQGAPDSIPR